MKKFIATLITCLLIGIVSPSNAHAVREEWKAIGTVTARSNSIGITGRIRTITYTSTKFPNGNKWRVSKAEYDTCSVGETFYVVSYPDIKTDFKVEVHRCK